MPETNDVDRTVRCDSASCSDDAAVDTMMRKTDELDILDQEHDETELPVLTPRVSRSPDRPEPSPEPTTPPLTGPPPTYPPPTPAPSPAPRSPKRDGHMQFRTELELRLKKPRSSCEPCEPKELLGSKYGLEKECLGEHDRGPSSADQNVMTDEDSASAGFPKRDGAVSRLSIREFELSDTALSRSTRAEIGRRRARKLAVRTSRSARKNLFTRRYPTTTVLEDRERQEDSADLVDDAAGHAALEDE